MENSKYPLVQLFVKAGRPGALVLGTLAMTDRGLGGEKMLPPGLFWLYADALARATESSFGVLSR